MVVVPPWTGAVFCVREPSLIFYTKGVRMGYVILFLDFATKVISPTIVPIAAAGDHLTRTLKIVVPDKLADYTATINIERPDGTRGADLVDIVDGAIEYPVARKITERGIYVISLSFVRGEQVYNTLNAKLRVLEHLSAGPDELPGEDPSLAEQILGELGEHDTRIDALEAGGGGGTGSVTKTYVDAQDAATLASANAYTDSGLATKQPKGSYLTNENDPTVPAWAKEDTKPTYTATEVGAETSGSVNAHNTSGTAHEDIRTALAGKQPAGSYLTSETDPLFTAWDKDYEDLTNKPVIPIIVGLTQAEYDALPVKDANTLYVIVEGEVPSDTTPPTLTGSLTAVPTTGQVALSWNAATDNVAVTGYDIEYGTTNDYGTVSTSATNSKTITGLANGTLYYFRVRAHDAAGNKSNWITATATTAIPADTTSPTLTGSITATPNPTSLALGWNVATDNVAVTGYDIEWGTSTSYGSTKTSAANSTTLTGLTADTTYYYRVRAYDAAGNKSDWITGSSSTSEASASETTLYLNGSSPLTLRPSQEIFGGLFLGDIRPTTTVEFRLGTTYISGRTIGTGSIGLAQDDPEVFTTTIPLTNTSFTQDEKLFVHFGLGSPFEYSLAGKSIIGDTVDLHIWSWADPDEYAVSIVFESAEHDSYIKLVVG